MENTNFSYQVYVEGLKQTLDALPWHKVEQVVDLLESVRRSGHTVFVFGNGGSAATATHMACDLSKNTAVPGQERLRVLSLNDNMALFSALGNNWGNENVVAEQLAT